ncbi:NIPA-like 2, partial [Phaethon lepturus]
FQILEIIIFCILLYFYKIKAVKHIVVLLMMVALLASLTVIAVKAVASMIILSAKGKMQLTYPVFYIMIVLMATSCAFQVKFLNQAMHLYEAKAVVPINFAFFTTSAIISGVVFYQEFQSAALLSVFMFLFGCLLSFLGVFVIARNKKEEHLQIHFIDCGHIPGQKFTGKIQPDSHSSHYGTLNNEDNSVK